MENQALWANTLVPGVKIWYDDTFKQYMPRLDKVFSVDSSGRAWEEYMDSTGVGKLVDVGEAGAVPYDDKMLVVVKPLLIEAKPQTDNAVGDAGEPIWDAKRLSEEDYLVSLEVVCHSPNSCESMRA